MSDFRDAEEPIWWSWSCYLFRFVENRIYRSGTGECCLRRISFGRALLWLSIWRELRPIGSLELLLVPLRDFGWSRIGYPNRGSLFFFFVYKHLNTIARARSLLLRTQNMTSYPLHTQTVRLGRKTARAVYICVCAQDSSRRAYVPARVDSSFVSFCRGRTQ